LWLFSGNIFRCNWAGGVNFFRWYSKEENKPVLQNVDETICQADQVAFGNMTLLGAFKIKLVS
jgi:hypothetical protein